MKIYFSTITVILFLFGSVPAYADREGCGLKAEVEHAERRIDRGVEDGTLSPQDARALEQERSEIRQLFRDLRESDLLSQGGCDILERRIARLNAHISELKHGNRDYDNGSDGRYRYGSP